MSHTNFHEALDLQQLAPFVFTAQDVLTEAECGSLIQLAEAQLQESTILGRQIDGYRTSSGTWLREGDQPEIVPKIRRMVSALTQLPTDHQEHLQILRYQVGQQYKVHEDFWHPKTDYYEREMKRGGQRAWTVMIYLNTVEQGGGTGFPKLNLEVKAVRGRLIAWQNTLQGNLNYQSTHAGLPVIKGEKWAAVTWVREQPFR